MNFNLSSFFYPLLAVSLLISHAMPAMSVSDHTSKAFDHLRAAGKLVLKNSVDIARERPIATAFTVGLLGYGTYYVTENIIPRLRANQATLNAVIPGSIIGMGAGLSAYCLDRCGLLPVSWLMTSAMRNKVVTSLSNAMTNRNVAVDQTLMKDTALVSDWMTWFALLNRLI